MITELKNVVVPEMEQELKNILRFWADNTLDTINGGFVGELDYKCTQIDNAEKGAVLNARLLWSFSAAYNFTQDPSYLKLADRAYEYFVHFFWDNEHKGVVWALNPDGSVSNSRKQAYAQGFALYGLSEYYRASGNTKSLDYAIELFRLIETHFKDLEFGGYIEALSVDWQPLEDMRLSEKDANEPKSMNTHLHIIEPYTNLYREWPNKELKERIQALIALFADKIIDPVSYHFNLFFDMDWKVKSKIVSYGHDIEGAWLLNEAAHLIHDEELFAKTKAIAQKMVDVTMTDGLDTDGSLLYELEEDGHLDTDKHWWPQAEALVGLLDTYQNTQDTKYLLAAQNVWQFIATHIVDKKNGEWFWKVDKAGTPDLNPPKVGFWKCPYHNSRALIEAITRIKQL